jgi:hypothetical protein
MAPWPYAPSKFGQSQTPTYGGITSGYTQSTIWVVAPTMSYPDSYAVSKRKLETHLQSLRRRREVVHGPPPVVLELCTLPMPEKLVRSHPRGTAWLARTHGGQRERRALRAVIERKDSA